VGVTIESYGKLEISYINDNKNNNKKRSKNNKSPKLCLGDLIIIRNGAKTISPPNFVWNGLEL
jgi:hypothetical protein